MKHSVPELPRSAPSRRRDYVLVHGAWHGGWVWRKVADDLRALGHTVYAPTLTGLGERRHLLRPGINLDTHADDIVNLIEMERLTEVILVGWSYGGMVIADVLARIPERIASMVYLDAFAPERGRSQVSYATVGPGADALVQLAAEGRDIPPLPLKSMGWTDEALAAFGEPPISPQPVMTYLQASKALPVRPPIPHTYVAAGRSVSKTFLPFLAAFEADPESRAMVVDATHAMMFTNPQATLSILASCA
ncbi:MAG: alpha/beta fold hydrolase [Acidobacteria bacterium]|nr:alpha/beta fold hydrolase [Acidobacteriota bacterium]